MADGGKAGTYFLPASDLCPTKERLVHCLLGVVPSDDLSDGPIGASLGLVGPLDLATHV